jgi:phage-related tail fiber protein
VDVNSQRISGLADPTGAQDAATKNYVDTQMQSAAAGIDSKPSVRVVANANITLSGTQTIDGVAVIAGDRVLVRGQSTGSQNGVYVVAAGAWSRAVDGDQTGELTPGASWFVEEGTTYGKSTWRVENTGTITLGSTSITINQFTGAASYTASLGVQLVGSDFRAQVVAAGGVSAVAGGLQVDRTYVPNRYAVDIGNGSLTSIVVTHNLNTKDVVVSVRQNSDDAHVMCDIVSTSVNTCTLTFAVAPAASALRVTVIG